MGLVSFPVGVKYCVVVGRSLTKYQREEVWCSECDLAGYFMHINGRDLPGIMYTEPKSFEVLII